MGEADWKAVHWLSLPGFIAGLAHGILTGTDSQWLPVTILYLVTGAWVLTLMIFRAIPSGGNRRHAH